MRNLLRKWLGISDAPVAAVSAKPAFTISETALAKAREQRSPNTVVRRKLAPPELPPTAQDAEVIPAEVLSQLPQGMAFDDAQMSAVWGWSNAMSGYGCGLYFPGYQYLAELAQRSEYRIPSATIAAEMTRKWIKFKSIGKGDKAERLERIEAWFKKHKVQQAFRKAETLDGLFGLAHIYIDIKGQEDKRYLPLVISKETIPVGSVKGIKVIEAMWTSPLVWNSIDPTAPDYYKPTSWMVQGRRIHATRLLSFISREVPDLLKPAYNFGGLSLSQMMETNVNQWLRTRDAVADLLNNFSKMILLTDMTAVLTGGNGDNVLRRMQLATQFGSNQGYFVGDKTNEDFKNVAAPLGGLHELQAQSQEHMCAPSQMPLVKLTGITPSGLNASSDGEIQVWYDHIVSRQESEYTDYLNLLLQLAQLDIDGEIDDAIGFEYVPLTEPDGEALARQRKTDADAAGVYLDKGVITPDEDRERLASDPTSGYNNLSGSAPEPVEEPALADGEDDGEDEA